MKTVTMVKRNGTILYSWRERDGFINHTPGEFIAFARMLQGVDFCNQFFNDPHRFTFWMQSEIEARYRDGCPLKFPVLFEVSIRVFELIAESTDDFSCDNDFRFTASPCFRWVWFLDLDGHTFSVYDAYELLVDRTLMRNYDLRLELGCDGVPSFLKGFWIQGQMPDERKLIKACTETDCG